MTLRASRPAPRALAPTTTECTATVWVCLPPLISAYAATRCHRHVKGDRACVDRLTIVDEAPWPRAGSLATEHASAPVAERRHAPGRHVATPLAHVLLGAMIVTGVVALGGSGRANGGTYPGPRACQAPSVSLANGPYVGGATQEEAHSLAITNTASFPCSLHGYVGIVVYDTHGRPLAFRFAHRPTGGWPMATVVPARFTLKPRASAYVFLAQFACYTGYSSVSRRIAVRLPGDRRLVRLNLRQPIAYCVGASARVGNVLAVSPIEPTIAATQGPSPSPAARNRVSRPATVEP